MARVEPRRLVLRAWNRAGEQVLALSSLEGTVAIAGQGDADAHVEELGETTIFVRRDGDQVELIQHASDAKTMSRRLAAGQPLALGPLTFVVMWEEDAAEETFDHGDSSLLLEATRWASGQMDGELALRRALTEFLSLVMRGSRAASGMLVLAEESGFTLVASEGLKPPQAQKLWEKIPSSLPEQVLKTGARILLPEEVRGAVGRDSTVFVRGVRSVAGFPVLAESRLLAIYFLGFDNLLVSLSPELQATLEAAADVLGLVLQRAALREQIESLKLSATARERRALLPEGRLMVGESPALAEVYRTIVRLAPVDVSVLITGETGTGKELAAKEIHRFSQRAARPFIVVNAAALPESLIESELFGHRKGAFTGALTDRAGLVERADGGTLFIDEIGELPLPLQAKLLRVLQERAVIRLGDAEPREVNFRLISATHRDLEAMVAEGTFREDLYYRIAGAALRMPALRERREDILALANHFRRRFAERHRLPDKDWSADALLALPEAPWPGNVRELENTVARAFVMAEGPVITRQDLGLPEGGAGLSSHDVDSGRTLNEARDEWMRRFISEALKRHGGRRADTARALGIGERTLFRYLEQYDIRP